MPGFPEIVVHRQFQNLPKDPFVIDVATIGTLNASTANAALFAGNVSGNATNLMLQTNYANDAAAAAGGVPVRGLYGNGAAVQIRLA